MGIRILEENPSFAVEDTRGYEIVKPTRMVRTDWYHPLNRGNGTQPVVSQNSVSFREGWGTFLQKNDETGVVIWPTFASGWDDILSRAIVGGYMANIDVTPIVDTYASTVVAKIQNMVRTWVNRVRGRRHPVKKTLDIMARADDSQFGSAEFVGNFMGALCVDNRGAMGAQVPFAYIDFDKWEEFGMVAEPIPDEGNRNAREKFFVLRMSQDAFRENQGLWTVDGMHCYPTGIPEYPYWFRAYSKEQKALCWTLIHKDFGWQILAQAGPRDSNYPGFGQSGTWRYSPYVAKGIAINTMDWEHLIAQPMRGIVWASGLDRPTQFADQLKTFQKDKEQGGTYFYPGVFFGGSVNEAADIQVLPWSEPPAGYTPEKWIREKVDALAAAFHISSTQLQVRLGEGALTQSDVSAAMEAETAVAFWRHAVEMLWNYVAPPRITVTTIWPSDRNKNTMVGTFRELMLGVQRGNQKPKGSEEGPTFDREDVRLLTKEFVGIPLPDTEDEEISAEDRHSGQDIPESASFLPEFPSDRFSRRQLRSVGAKLPSLPERNGAVQAWDTVLLRESNKLAVLSEWDGESEWAWVITEDGFDMLLHVRNIVPLSMPEDGQGENGSGQGSNGGGDESDHGPGHVHESPTDADRPYAVPHPWKAGDIATDGSFRYKLVNLWPEEQIAHGYHLGDQTAAKYTLKLDNLLPLAFEPEGDPLDYPEEIDIDWTEALAAAEALQGRIIPEFVEGNWVWNEDERLWENEDTGETMTEEEMAQVRDALADGSDELYTGWPPDEDEEEPESEEDSDNLVWLLFLGILTLGEWERRMRTAIRDTSIAQWMLGRGGRDQLQDEDLSRLEDYILVQWQFLNAFSNSIALGQLSEAQIAWEAGLYFSDTVRAAEEGRSAAWSYDLVLPAYPGDGSSECMANDRCRISYVNMGDTLEIEWVRTVSESCPTCIRRAACAPLVFFKDTGELQGGACWL